MATDPVKTEMVNVQPIAVAIIGGTGDGGAPIPTGTVLTTPDHQPNVIVTVITPIMAIVVRFTTQFLTTLLGLVTAGMTPAGAKVIQAADFWHLVLTCASLSVVGAGVGLIKDLVTVFGRLEGKYPLLTGSV